MSPTAFPAILERELEIIALSPALVGSPAAVVGFHESIIRSSSYFMHTPFPSRQRGLSPSCSCALSPRLFIPLPSRSRGSHRCTHIARALTSIMHSERCSVALELVIEEATTFCLSILNGRELHNPQLQSEANPPPSSARYEDFASLFARTHTYTHPPPT